MNWQKQARLGVAIGGVAFAVVVALGFRHGTPTGGGHVATSDPKAVVESSQGTHNRTSRSKEDLNVAFQHLTSYSDGSSRLDGIALTTTRANGREFKITAKEARVTKDETEFAFTGDVRIAVSDGMLIHTEHATYADATGRLLASGAVDIARARMTGSSIGLTYDKTADLLSLLDKVQLHLAPDERGGGVMEINAPSAVFNRPDKTIRFDAGIQILARPPADRCRQRRGASERR